MDSDAASEPLPPRDPPGADLAPRTVPTPPRPADQPRVEQATILAYRLYDVAAEVDLRLAETLLQGGAARLKLTRNDARYLELPNPPVSFSLGATTLPLRAGPIPVEVTARLFDFGTLSLLVQVPVRPGLPFEELIALADELYDCPALETLGRGLVEGLLRRLHPALESPSLWDEVESYTVTEVRRLEGDPNAEAVLARCDLPRLILGEPAGVELSTEQRADVLRGVHRYTERDLVLIDWNAAFVYEPGGGRDIPDLLEIANAQLLEMRFYDERLDHQLATIYDEVNRAKRPWWSLFSGRYGKLKRRTLALLLELGELTERVENSLKIIGDFYLARVYETALRQLRVPEWQHSVYRKQGLLNGVYSLLKSEVDTDRLLWLEITVVLLILGELVLALALHLHG
jgi:hypothetical protein